MTSRGASGALRSIAGEHIRSCSSSKANLKAEHFIGPSLCRLFSCFCGGCEATRIGPEFPSDLYGHCLFSSGYVAGELSCSLESKWGNRILTGLSQLLLVYLKERF